MARSINRFEVFIKRELKASKLNSKQSKDLSAYLLKASMLGSGNSPALLFGKNDIKLLSEFKAVMRRHRYPNAVKLRLDAPFPYHVLSQSERFLEPHNSSSKIKRLVGKITWAKLWSGKGYVVGGFMMDGGLDDTACTVYFCSDAKLRCLRSEPVFGDSQTKSCGAGNIPALSKLNPGVNFYSGNYVTQTDWQGEKRIVFQPKQLEEILKGYVAESIINKSKS